MSPNLRRDLRILGRTGCTRSALWGWCTTRPATRSIFSAATTTRFYLSPCTRPVVGRRRVKPVARPARWFGRRRPGKRWRGFDTRPEMWASSRWRSVPGTGTRPRGASPRDSSRWRPARSARFACGIGAENSRVPARPREDPRGHRVQRRRPASDSRRRVESRRGPIRHVRRETRQTVDAAGRGGERRARGRKAAPPPKPPKPRGDAQPPPQPRAESPRTRDTPRVCACATTETATGTARRRQTRCAARSCPGSTDARPPSPAGRCSCGAVDDWNTRWTRATENPCAR